jgi:hypothetical protein
VICLWIVSQERPVQARMLRFHQGARRLKRTETRATAVAGGRFFSLPIDKAVDCGQICHQHPAVNAVLEQSARPFVPARGYRVTLRSVELAVISAERPQFFCYRIEEVVAIAGHMLLSFGWQSCRLGL